MELSRQDKKEWTYSPKMESLVVYVYALSHIQCF